MSLSNLTDRQAVVAAMQECDALGRDAFLNKYQFGPAKHYFLNWSGKQYDSKAIAGAAHGFQHGTPLTLHQFSGGENTVARKLRSLGFDVAAAEKDHRRGADWSQAEVNATVEDYFAMLRLEMLGQSYNKKDHRQKLLVRLNNRSHAAVKLKHQNISAVLDGMGLPYITGYKPRKNDQGALAAGVEDYVSSHADFFATLAPVATTGASAQVYLPADWKSVLVDPPASTPNQPPVEPKLAPAFKPKHYDFAQSDAKYRSLGKNGEEFVLKYEKLRLADSGRPDLAERVEWLSQTQGDGAGFDIASFDTNGEPLFIEVKTTNCPKTFPFIITDRELDFADTHAANFRLYRVFDFSRTPKLFVLNGSLRDVLKLKPKSFEASF